VSDINVSVSEVQTISATVIERSLINVTIQGGIGGPASVNWGGINGTLSDQADLQTALDTKLESSSIANFETSTQLDTRDTNNRNRSNHTGSQAISTVTGLQSALDAKPDNAVLAIWAEENSSLSNSTAAGYQWSFGNGATNIPNIVIPYNGTVNKMSLSCFTAATGTVELYVNRAATGATISVTSETSNFSSSLGVTISEGDEISFRTISGSGGDKCVVAAFVEID
jgi:hypothetical protein